MRQGRPALRGSMAANTAPASHSGTAPSPASRRRRSLPCPVYDQKSNTACGGRVEPNVSKLEGYALAFKVADREHGDRVGLGNAFSCGRVAWERMSVTCARGNASKKRSSAATVRVCERTKQRRDEYEHAHTRWPRRRAQPAIHLVQARALSDAFASRWSAHGGTAWKAPSRSSMGALRARWEYARLFWRTGDPCPVRNTNERRTQKSGISGVDDRVDLHLRDVPSGRKRGLAEGGPPLRTTYLMVSLDDGDRDELTSGDRHWVLQGSVCGVSEDLRVRLEVVRPRSHGLEGAAQAFAAGHAYTGTRESNSGVF
ncbi:hypothetical protein BC826DRAFT_1176767 [Russula brevipes]|nr:hypothetical protein BC826DRAFT_1176767 [Russula brevipes]